MSESSLGSSPNLLPRASPSATAAMLTPNTRLLQTCKSSNSTHHDHTQQGVQDCKMPFTSPCLYSLQGLCIDVGSMHAADPAQFVTAALQGNPAIKARLASLSMHLNTLIEG